MLWQSPIRQGRFLVVNAYLLVLLCVTSLSLETVLGDEAQPEENEQSTQTDGQPDESQNKQAGVKEGEEETKPSPAELAANLANELISNLKIKEIGEEEELSEFDDENPFIFPIEFQRKRIGHEEVTVRYREEEYTKTIYKDIKQPYTKRVPIKDKDGYVIGHKLVTVQRTVRRVPIRKEQRTKLVRDSNGPIEKAHKRAIYGPGGPDRLSGEWLGNNAMALYALASLAQKDHRFAEAAEKMGDGIAQHVRRYGLPDRTRELAWLVIGLCKQEPQRYDGIIKEAVQKLLAGQQHDGPLAGLWGEVCVNVERLKTAHQLESKITQALQEAGGFEEVETNEEVQRLSAIQLSLQKKIIAEVSREVYWHLLEADRTNLRIRNMDQPIPDEVAAESEIPGLPYNPIKEQQADLYSTSLVAFAFKASHEAELWPEQLDAMVFLDQVRSTEKPVRTSQLVNQTLQALMRRQKLPGQWLETHWVMTANSRRPVTLVEEKKPVLFDTLAAVSTIEALATLPGTESNFRVIKPRIAEAQEYLEKQIADFEDLKLNVKSLSKDRTLPTWTTDTWLLKGQPVGGRIPPYDLLTWMQLSGRDSQDEIGPILEAVEKITADKNNLWARIDRVRVTPRVVPENDPYQRSTKARTISQRYDHKYWVASFKRLAKSYELMAQVALMDSENEVEEE